MKGQPGWRKRGEKKWRSSPYSCAVAEEQRTPRKKGRALKKKGRKIPEINQHMGLGTDESLPGRLKGFMRCSQRIKLE